MTKQFKALQVKKEFSYSGPDKGLLEWFENPGVREVTLVNKEFTSLCPITGQPDYSEITITYYPKERCIESKSLKLYCVSFRNYGAFTEKLAQHIAHDLHEVLECQVEVLVASVSRGGITVCAKGVIYD